MTGTIGSPSEPEAWDDWVADVGRHVADGFSHLDLLTAVDRVRTGEIEVVIHLQRRTAEGALEDAWGRTLLARHAPVLPSVVAVLPSAGWHEREIAEMFGVEVDGHPDLQPLLLHGADGPPPLLKDTPLVARVETPWPGQAEGARAKTPGVPPEWRDAT